MCRLQRTELIHQLRERYRERMDRPGEREIQELIGKRVKQDSRLQSVGKSSQKAPWQLESGWSALTCKMELLAKVRPWRRSWSMSSTCMGSMQGMGRRLWECNVTGGLQSSLLEVLASYYVVWQYLCHICCAQHGSPWNEIVGASRATSNKDLQFASMPCLFGAMLGRDDFASILFGGNGQEASLKMPSSLTTGI